MPLPLLARAQDPVQTPPQYTQTEQSSSPSSNSSSTTGQSPPQPAAPNPQELYDPAESDKVTLLPHSDTEGYWISAQANVVFQWHPSFPAKYTGTNSMTPEGQSATTHVITLYTGWTVTPTTELFADFEYATGGGIGRAFGLAGYTNLDSVRTVSGAQLSTTPYLARLMLRQIIPLTDERIEAERDELHLATSLPARRIEFRIGKFDLADFFDLNTWGSGQPSAIPELDGGQQRRLRLRRQHARLYRRRAPRIRRPLVDRALRRSADAESRERHPSRCRYRARARRKSRTRGTRQSDRPSRRRRCAC